MAKDGSVAPKERVNIVYKPATGDAQEQVELPLKQLVVGDFTLKESDTPVDERKPIQVDKDNFNDVLKAQGLDLTLSEPNRLSDNPSEDEQIPVTLKFQNIRDFEPDSIVDQVPELRQLIELREALKALKGPLGNLPDFRKKLQALIQDEGARERLLGELGVQDNNPVAKDKE
jgi:type VI secretion system protein ImpB